MTAIRLIVGLGNPGREYESTRHNAGFRWVDVLARLHKLDLRNETKFHGLTARGQLLGREMLLLEPQTFMNASGRAVGALVQF
ncbi:MAG: aminoacyl-tRNA hydrolase, partial [Gallionella sp.]